MIFFKEKLKYVRALIFDNDGVLSMDTTSLTDDGDPVRTTNVKDGYAIRNAVNMGYHVAIISGGNSERVQLRYQKLGIPHIYMRVAEKLKCLHEFMEKTGVKAEEILYMGDDVVDCPVMRVVGVPVCPADAVADVKEVALYISDLPGGHGCVRDVIEQVMKSQDTWLNDKSYYWRSI